MTKDELEELYLVQKKSTVDIAKILGISKSSARRLLIKNSIKLRTRLEGEMAVKHKLGQHLKGKKRPPFGDEWKRKISESQKNSPKHKREIKKPTGYIEVAIGDGKYRHQHIVIMEKHLGRSLLRHEVVHHKNGVRDDNRLENLEVMSRSDHAKLHINERIKKGEILELHFTKNKK